MGNKEAFNYTYCAKEQEEIKAIRNKYAPPEKTETNMEKLRRLDASATNKATVIALVAGIIGALIMGTGMSLAMTDIGETLGLSQRTAMLLGIPLGLLGIFIASMAYPLYNRTLKAARKKIAPEIIRLTDELMK